MFHKMQKGEEEKAADILTEAFSGYPVYKAFFKGCKNPDKLTKLSLQYFVYTNPNSVYLNDDGNFVACFEKPSDKNPSQLLTLIKHPGYILKMLFRMPLAAKIRILKYQSMSDKCYAKNRKKGDNTLHLLATTGAARGSRLIFRFLYEYDDGKPFCCETHSEHNLKMYQRMGMTLVKETDFMDVKHYFLRRSEDAVYDYYSPMTDELKATLPKRG